MSKRSELEPAFPSEAPSFPILSKEEPSSTATRKRRPTDSPSSKMAQVLTNEVVGGSSSVPLPPAKKSRTNTPWTPAEEQRLRVMRDAGNSWAEIAKMFPSRTEGSVKKHWYKDMHYADFAEDEVPETLIPTTMDSAPLTMHQSTALLNAIKEYEANKWKVIGAKLGKPAKACEQYARENFAGKL